MTLYWQILIWQYVGWSIRQTAKFSGYTVGCKASVSGLVQGLQWKKINFYKNRFPRWPINQILFLCFWEWGKSSYSEFTYFMHGNSLMPRPFLERKNQFFQKESGHETSMDTVLGDLNLSEFLSI